MSVHPAQYFLSVAHGPIGGGRLIVAQAEVNSYVVTGGGSPGVPVGADVPLSNGTIGAASGNWHQAFRLVLTADTFGDRSYALSFHYPGFEALGGQKNALINAMLQGQSLGVTVQGGDTLEIRLRALRTTDFIVDPTLGTATPARYSTDDASGTNVPPAEAGMTYSYSLNVGATELVGDPVTGVFALGASTAPPDPFNRTLTVTLTPTSGPPTTVTFAADLHLPTQVIALLDRSGSMQATSNTGTTSKWNEATTDAQLFAAMYKAALPTLGADQVNVSSLHELSIITFRSSGGYDAEYLPATGFDPVATFPAFAPAAAGGGTPIGQAITDAASRFTVSTTWGRRHLLLLTDGKSNTGMPDFTTVLGAPPANVKIHVISYTEPGESDLPALSTLASGGQFHATDSEPTSTDVALREMFLNVIRSVIPLEIPMVSPTSETQTDVFLEPNLERAIFLVPGEHAGGTAVQAVTAGGGTTGSNSTSAPGSGFTSTFVDRPVGGNWTITHPNLPGNFASSTSPRAMALLDVNLRSELSISSQDTNQPISAQVRLHERGHAISGADVRVVVHRPGEALGDALGKFVRSGGLVKSMRSGQLGRSALGVLSHATAISSIGTTSASAAADVSKVADRVALQAQLRTLMENYRGFPVQAQATSFAMNEVEPGVYQVTIPRELVQAEGVYTLQVLAEGVSLWGVPFSRRLRESTVVSHRVHPETTSISLVPQGLHGGTQWTVTLTPRSATGHFLGPGLTDRLVLSAKIDEKTRSLTLQDQLDGSYTAVIDAAGSRAPALFLADSAFAADKVLPLVPDAGTKKVRVVLEAIEVLDEKDSCFAPGEFRFDSVVALNENPATVVRRSWPESGVTQLVVGQKIQISQEIFSGYVASDTRMSVTVGGKEFDWLLFFRRQEKLARYHRTFTVPAKTEHFVPGDEAHDPEALSDWRIWYSVEVG